MMMMIDLYTELLNRSVHPSTAAKICHKLKTQGLMQDSFIDTKNMTTKVIDAAMRVTKSQRAYLAVAEIVNHHLKLAVKASLEANPLKAESVVDMENRLKKTCGNPECQNPTHREIYIRQKCHPGARLIMRYEKGTGVVNVLCGSCKLPVLNIGVALV